MLVLHLPIKGILVFSTLTDPMVTQDVAAEVKKCLLCTHFLFEAGWSGSNVPRCLSLNYLGFVGAPMKHNLILLALACCAYTGSGELTNTGSRDLLAAKPAQEGVSVLNAERFHCASPQRHLPV